MARIRSQISLACLGPMEPPIFPDALAGQFSAEDHHFHQGYLTEEQADDDAAEVLGLLELEPGARLLDAGCGDGRLAVRLAALGYVVVGVDSDPAQLERAHARRIVPGARLAWRCADLADLDEPGGFDGVFSWFNSLGFGSGAHHERVLDALCAALRPGGTLVIDTLDPEVLSEILASQTEAVLVRVGGDVQSDRSHLDVSTGRLEVERVATIEGVTTTRQLSVHLFTPAQWAAAFERRGVELVAATARAGAPHEDSDGELVVVGRRS